MKRTAILAITALALLTTGCAQMHKAERTCAVVDKEMARVGSGETSRSEYRVYCEDGQVFTNTDALVFGEKWKTNSASVQATIQVGQTYRFRTIGWRISWLSMFPNIITATPVRASNA